MTHILLTQSLNALILPQNPPPDVPAVELDEGLCEVLAPQERNVSKYYHHHQVALTAAASRKTPETLQLLTAEIKSQSKFFKKYAVRHYVKQQGDDKMVVELVKAVPPSVQKLLIHALIKAKRTEALDVLADEMRKIAGVDYVVDFLHGCRYSLDCSLSIVTETRFHDLYSAKNADHEFTMLSVTPLL